MWLLNMSFNVVIIIVYTPFFFLFLVEVQDYIIVSLVVISLKICCAILFSV